MEIIECRGVRYAVGLYWWQASEKGELRAPLRTARRLVHEIESMADLDSKTLFCDTVAFDRATGRIGLGASHGSERVYALAPALARARPETGALWCLETDPGRMIVVATLKGQVLGEGDFSGSLSEGRARLALLLDQYGERLSERIMGRRGDPEWALLEDALGKIPLSSLPRTRPLYRRGRRRLVLSLVALLLLGLVAWTIGFRSYFSTSKTVVMNSRNARNVVTMATTSHRGIMALPPSSVLAVCQREWEKLGLVDEGWSFARFVCTGQRAVVVWRYRPGASFTHLPGSSLLTPNPKQVVSTFVLRPGPETNLTQSLVARSQLEGDFYAWVRRAGIRAAALNWQNSASGAVDPWAKAAWSVELGRGDPFRLLPSLSAFKGLSIHQMEATLSLNGRLVWHLTGVIYANPW